MNARRTLLSASVLLSAVLASPAASAGTTSPVSALATLPKPIALKTPEQATVPGVSVKTKDGYGGTRWHDVAAATGRGYCLASTESGSRWMSNYGTSSKGAAEDLDLDRLVEKDGKVTLERTRVHFEPSDASLTAKGRSQVELHEIAKTDAGIVVWAYRDGSDIIVLARNVDRGQESRQLVEEGNFPFVSADGCAYAGARLDGRKPEAGTFVQLGGSLPPKGTGKDKVTPRFMIDASLSRLSRDPEPMLAVRVRVRD